MSSQVLDVNCARRFEPFLDHVDGVVCAPATSTNADLEVQLAGTGLRFPLVLDRKASIAAQVAASTHAPASSRFGPFCDNVLGMNWRLPDGRVVRLGERVVKSTTGYDLFRFLLHSGNHFGVAVDYVLRLRPDPGCARLFRLDGSPGSLRGSVRSLLRSACAHWFDAVDFVADARVSHVRITVHCIEQELPAFAAHLNFVAAEFGLRLQSQSEVDAAQDGCPDIVFKTTPDRVCSLAGQVAQDGVRCVALCYCGIVHVHLPRGSEIVSRVQEVVQPHASALYELGGDWRSRHVPSGALAEPESAWLAEIERAFSSL